MGHVVKASAAMVSLSAIVASVIAFSPQLFKGQANGAPPPPVAAAPVPVGALALAPAFANSAPAAAAGFAPPAPAPAKPAATDLAEANRKLADAMTKPRAQDGLSQISGIAGGPSATSAVGRRAGSTTALAYATPTESIESAVDLIARARAQLRDGAASSARLLLARAARSGSAEALTLLGQSYDPAALKELGAKGVRADRAEARKFYQQAAEAGSAEARKRLDKLGG